MAKRRLTERSKKMKLMINALWILAFLGVSDFAVAKPKPPSHVTESRDYFGPSRNESQTRVPLSLGIPLFSGLAGVALHAGMDFKVSRSLPLFIGFETGLDILGNRYYYTDHYTYYGDSSNINIPLLVSALFRFELPRVPTLHPYAGIVAGPYLVLNNGTGITFEGMLRPGISWTFAKGMDLHGEPRFGIIGSRFVVQPTVGITFVM